MCDQFTLNTNVSAFFMKPPDCDKLIALLEDENFILEIRKHWQMSTEVHKALFHYNFTWGKLKVLSSTFIIFTLLIVREETKIAFIEDDPILF